MKTFTSTTPLDIVHVTSSALRKIEKHPHSWTFTSTPLGPCPCDVIHIPRGGGDRSRSRTLCIGFQYRGSSRGGDHPCHPPPLDPPLLSETKKLGETKAERTTYHHNALLTSKSYYNVSVADPGGGVRGFNPPPPFRGWFFLLVSI